MLEDITFEKKEYKEPVGTTPMLPLVEYKFYIRNYAFYLKGEDYIKRLDELFTNLDKYQDKYKLMWSDMKVWFYKRNNRYDTPKSLELENFVLMFMQELEQKYKIGDDK